jgi:hypothetical protein
LLSQKASIAGEIAGPLRCESRSDSNTALDHCSITPAPAGCPKLRPAKGPPAVSADKVLRSFNTWAFKREQPDDPALMRQVIAEAIERREPVPFVLYWGKGPRQHVNEHDIQCLDYLAALAQRVRAAYPQGAAITLIFTDTHAALNGHSRHSIDDYFGAVEAGARTRGFACGRLSECVRAADATAADHPIEDALPAETLRQLGASAAKWYRGEGTAEQGAARYYRMNMVEKRAVQLAFPRTIFVTFNGSELRCLFPERLPVFYMYSLRRGVSVKPWFLPALALPEAAE